MRTVFVLLCVFVFISMEATSQIITREDSLTAGLIAKDNATVLSGYGSFNYQNNFTTEESKINVDRVVLFVGHKFNKKISFFSELELENARIANGQTEGEFALEQAFLKFDVNKRSYISAGLFIPRIGIINENHLPNTFNGSLRPYVETLIIPATWRELGVGYYTSSKRIPGLNYSIAVINGLNSSGFSNGSGIKEGRYEGSNASASAVAITGALLHYRGALRTQISGYYGGSAGLNSRMADSLQLNSGAFGTPVGMGEINVQYLGNRWQFKGLATLVALPDARAINRAYANNTAEQIFGAYAEVAYNFIKSANRTARVFARYEVLNMNFKLPDNAIYNGTIDQQYLIAGFCFLPISGVIIKADYTYRTSGDVNPALTISPYPQALPYFTQQHQLNVSLGYSF